LRREEQAPFCPDEAECLALLESYGTPPHVVAHCRAVARAADRMGAALSARGFSLNLPRICAAALLHDIARKSPDHAHVGAAYLQEAGVDPWICDSVAVHMDLPEERTREITEAVVVFLADKLVAEAEEVSLDQRYARQMAKADDDLRAIIQRKYQTARQVYQMVQDALNPE
jgi:HD superfamily phosphodiesterase